MATVGGEVAGSEPLALVPVASSEDAGLAPALSASAGKDPGVMSLALSDGPGNADMMARFEALSKMFKCEVEGLLGSQKETAKEDLGRLEERNRQLEDQVTALRAEAGGAIDCIRRFMAEQQGDQLDMVFGAIGQECNDSAGPGSGNAELFDGRLRRVVDAFLQVNGADERPEIKRANQQVAEMRARAEADFAELARLRSELAEARQLKSQEERELAEFSALREKESEAQAAKLEVEQLRCELEELNSQGRQLNSRADQQQALLKEKSDKIVELVRRLEQQSEQVRLLSDENNTLRLELGRDMDYAKVAIAPADPLSYNCAAGVLSEELQAEEKRMCDDLQREASKFPGLGGGGGNCRKWCQVQITRVRGLHRSFLHRLQDHQEVFPEGVGLEFVSQVQEVGDEWTQQEQLMREADAAFQEAEKVHTKRWEEHRLKLTAERDAKVKQLLEQAEKSQSKAEQQLLMHQAKLFGSRIDAQVERAWEEQRKERDLRWKEHQQQKVETRQKLKDESLSVRQNAEEKASASSRFVDLAAGKLAGVEDAWLRNSDKAALVSVASLKGTDLGASLRSATGSEEAPRLPARGAQHTGTGQVLDAMEEMLRARVESRGALRNELEEQSLQQLRGCVEKFVVKEATESFQARSSAGGAGGEEAEPTVPASAQAASISSLLRMRQHRHLSDTLRRQFQDYLLVLRIGAQAAQWLLPPAAAEALRQGAGTRAAGGGACQDLPPPPVEMRGPKDGAVSSEESDPDIEEAKEEEQDGVLGDTAAEAESLYNGLCQRIIERALTMMSAMQREELLGLKRAYVSEVRLALESLCQLEGDAVAAAVKQDLEEFQLQTSVRLLAESENGVCEERKKLVAHVEGEVAVQIAFYRRQLEEEEQAVVKERRKWLTDRLVVMQANGATGPADRALLKRLRQELRACEAKIERHDNQRAEEAKPVSSPAATPHKAVSSSPRPTSGERTGRRSRPSSASKNGRRPSEERAGRAQPEPPAAQPPAGQLPPRPEARPSPRQPTAVAAAPNPPTSARAAAAQAVRYSQIDMDMLCGEGPSSMAPQDSAQRPVPSPRQLLPQFGDSAGLHAKIRESPDFGHAGGAPGLYERPLYEWPFEPAGPGDAAAGARFDPAGGSTPRSARGPSASAAQLRLPSLRPLDESMKSAAKVLDPQAIPHHHFASEYDTGVYRSTPSVYIPEVSGTWTPRAGAPRHRSVPPLLPPVHTPRG